MEYQICATERYIKAAVTNRTTAEETEQYLAALQAAVERHRIYRVLIDVDASVAIFRVEQFHLGRFLEFAKKVGARIALTSDTREVRLAHQYVELLAKNEGVNLRAFADEQDAIEWLDEG